jgi:hypothetical protein
MYVVCFQMNTLIHSKQVLCERVAKVEEELADRGNQYNELKTKHEACKRVVAEYKSKCQESIVRQVDEALVPVGACTCVSNWAPMA